jgi:hypothetical protein
VVLAGVALAAPVVANRSRGRAPERPAAAAEPSTTTAGDSATGGRSLRAPDTLGGIPRSADPFTPPPAIAGGRAITAFYSSSDDRQHGILVAAGPGVLQAPGRIASIWAQGLDGSPGTFKRFPRDALDIRCADVKGPTGKVVIAVCYLDRPDLNVVVTGAPPTRIADMVAEAYRKLKA